MRKFSTMFVGVLLVNFALSQDLPPGSQVKLVDLSKFFGDNAGSFVLYDVSKNEYLQYNSETCRTRYTPCSTFKIANSLVALQSGAAHDTSFLIYYNKSQHPIQQSLLSREPFKHWPYDQTMTSAFRYSVVWYYQELAKKIGDATMQRYLDSLHYGNQDISSGIDHFWLSGSLRISANEQVQIVTNLVKNQLAGFSRASQEKVKGIMLRESTDQYKVYGKTGGCDCGPDSAIGWFVGFVDVQSKIYVFALNVFVKSFDELAGRREEMTKQILHSLRIL